MQDAAPGEGLTILPRAGWFQDAPLIGDSGFANAGKGVNECVFLAEVEEGKIGLGVAVSGEAAGNVVLGETKDFLVPLVVFAVYVGEECDFFTPIESGAKA